jgi:hypothetical protein
VHETWKLGYLIDTSYLRDLRMHRIDAAGALGRVPSAYRSMPPSSAGRSLAGPAHSGLLTTIIPC